MIALGWDQCDVIIVTGDAYVDHPSFGMAMIGRVCSKRRGYALASSRSRTGAAPSHFARSVGRRLFFGVTAGNMDSMVNRYTADQRIRSDDAYTAGGEAGAAPGPLGDRLRPAHARGLSATCRSSLAASKPRCAALPISTTGRKTCGARSCSMPGRPAGLRQRRTRDRRDRHGVWRPASASRTSAICVAPRLPGAHRTRAGSRSIRAPRGTRARSAAGRSLRA